MSGDYLWDRSGPADPDVVRLERMLGTLRQSDPLPALRRIPRARSVTFPIVFSAAAACVLALVGLTWFQHVQTTPGWDVTRVSGSPVVRSRPMGERAELGDGSWLDTRAGGRATIAVGDIGQVQVEPDTRIGLLRARPGDYRLQLARGTMHALIWSPPGQFLVETPSSTALDLGCAYTMTVNDDGSGLIRVTSGWVGFEWHGRESFIPQGAMCKTRPELGPGTPHYEDTSEAFRAALDVIDTRAGSDADRSAALTRVLTDARASDKVTLWHLLSRVDPSDRDRVFDRLASFVPPPDAVTREGIRAGDRRMLDRWWDNLGLESVNWWRVWEQKWPENRPGR